MRNTLYPIVFFGITVFVVAYTLVIHHGFNFFLHDLFIVKGITIHKRVYLFQLASLLQDFWIVLSGFTMQHGFGMRVRLVF